MKILKAFLGHHGNRMAFAVVAASLAGLVALFGGLYFMALRQDAQSRQNQIMMVEGGLKQMGDGLAGLTQDYAWWDDLYTNIPGGSDAWFSTNVSTAVTSGETADFVVIFDKDKKPFRAWHASGGEESDVGFASAEFVRQIEVLLHDNPKGQFPAKRGVISLADGAYMIAATHVYPITTSLLVDAEKQPIFILGYKLGQERLGSIGETYLLEGLTYLPGGADGLVKLTDVSGTVVGGLNWTPSRPGTAILKQSLPILFGAAALIFLFGGLIAWRSHRLASELLQRGDNLQNINDQIIHLNTELADKVKRLKEAQDEIVRKGRMEQLGQLTATVAHELRNPLGAVRTSAFLMERKLKGKGMEVDAQIERINKGVIRCDNIITQLLDFSRSKHLDCQSSDLDSWLAKTLDEEAGKLPEIVAITCELGLDGAHVPFDPARLQRAVVNLLSNASEALVGQGDDTAKLTRPDPAILVTTSMRDGGVVIAVRDNGPGIPPDVLARIREPLFTTKSFGTGLGVPAIEQIAVQHGGTLDIQSRPGEGACFEIWLPMGAVAESKKAA
jgi:signal transduction histidine kinase